MTEKEPKKQSKKQKLRQSLIQTLDLALEVYPDVKDLLKKDITAEKMADDILSSLQELTPSIIADLKGGKLRRTKALIKLKALKKLKI